ncbi:protein of unknown function [Rhodovastum atsumiense]|nr:protein of unknown function [Rhodovastum atsumiense]
MRLPLSILNQSRSLSGAIAAEYGVSWIIVYVVDMLAVILSDIVHILLFDDVKEARTNTNAHGSEPMCPVA